MELIIYCLLLFLLQDLQSLTKLILCSSYVRKIQFDIRYNNNTELIVITNLIITEFVLQYKYSYY